MVLFLLAPPGVMMVVVATSAKSTDTEAETVWLLTWRKFLAMVFQNSNTMVMEQLATKGHCESLEHALGQPRETMDFESPLKLSRTYDVFPRLRAAFYLGMCWALLIWCIMGASLMVLEYLAQRFIMVKRMETLIC